MDLDPNPPSQSLGARRARQYIGVIPTSGHVASPRHIPRKSWDFGQAFAQGRRGRAPLAPSPRDKRLYLAFRLPSALLTTRLTAITVASLALTHTLRVTPLCTTVRPVGSHLAAAGVVALPLARVLCAPPLAIIRFFKLGYSVLNAAATSTRSVANTNSVHVSSSVTSKKRNDVEPNIVAAHAI